MATVSCASKTESRSMTNDWKFIPVKPPTDIYLLNSDLKISEKNLTNLAYYKNYFSVL